MLDPLTYYIDVHHSTNLISLMDPPWLSKMFNMYEHFNQENIFFSFDIF